ncbi:hypothetical protein Goshw_001839 [Gossypium schwendimanii]|uniref:RNase H type-1 domain-containing protein n=1 Tax=Gossypium schwendimanii TaxID=34291 RepID=A0A7J9N5N0_GOSSC|nr:hypothetical protein [Gossypium schwendimanii]
MAKKSRFDAELWGLLDDLLLLHKQGYDEVIIQSDNLEDVIFINDNSSVGPKSTLIRRIQQILASERKWSLHYIPRETNRIVDALAKMVLSSGILHMFEKPPMEIKEILKEAFSSDNSIMNISMLKESKVMDVDESRKRPKKADIGKDEQLHHLGFYSNFTVDSMGRSGGLAFLWNFSDIVSVDTFSLNLIDVIVENFVTTRWGLTGFFGYLEASHRSASWNLL